MFITQYLEKATYGRCYGGGSHMLEKSTSKVTYRQPNKIIALLTFQQWLVLVCNIHNDIWMLQTKSSHLWKVRYAIILLGWRYFIIKLWRKKCYKWKITSLAWIQYFVEPDFPGKVWHQKLNIVILMWPWSSGIDAHWCKKSMSFWMGSDWNSIYIVIWIPKVYTKLHSLVYTCGIPITM